jgi:hypothetical protein
MIHSDIQNQLQFLIKTSAPPLIEVAEHATSTAQWTPGQRLPAHVLASLPNGRFEVRVGDQILDLNLPRNTQAGENIELTFVGDKPRLTFALSQDLANLASAKMPVSLSDAARFIGSLLQKGTVDLAQLAQAARTTPVVDSLPDNAAHLAQSLRQALAQSGLFYESHQAQWVGGERSLAMLLQEPQGRLSPLLTQPSSAAEAGKSTVVNASAAPVAEKSSAIPGQPASVGATEFEATDAGRLAAAAQVNVRPAGELVHPQATHLVQQQLHTLDSRQLVWQGQVWPGQDMYWEIEEEGSRSSGEVDIELAGWQTRLSLDLPAMGGVSAKIVFSQGLVRLDIAAELDASAELMRSRQALLAESFRQAGLPLAGVSIRHNEQG